MLIVEQDGSWLIPPTATSSRACLTLHGRAFGGRRRPVRILPARRSSTPRRILRAGFTRYRGRRLQGEALRTVALEVPTAKALCFRRKRYHPSPAIRPRRSFPGDGAP